MYFRELICTCHIMNYTCFSKVQIIVLAKTQVQIQSGIQICDRTKKWSLVKYGALGVKHVLGQWKEKLRFLPRLRDHQKMESHSFFPVLKVTKKPTGFKPLNRHDSKRLSTALWLEHTLQ